MTMGQQIVLGSFNFPIIRILIGVGILRIILKHERIKGGINGLDWGFLGWAGWAIICSSFYEDPAAALTLRLGIIYNVCGIYFLTRIFCQSIEDALLVCRIISIILVPLALALIYEKITGHNLFSVFGRVGEFSVIRRGKIRAQGPFSHSILAGTIGAVSLPLIIPLWSKYRRETITGSVACIAIIFASASSGPILSLMAAIGAMLAWFYRQYTRIFRWILVAGYIFLDLIMKDPAYYIMARIDISGGSTGWHRARLIESAIEHINEWWLAGTNYTRHWMPSGVSWSPEHTDITNYYIKMGVWGGLPLVIFFCSILLIGFKYVGILIRQYHEDAVDNQFLFWCLGSALFAHSVTGLGVSYFDQSFVFIYLTLGLIGSIYNAAVKFISNKNTSKI
jgi:hypothetical protein